MKCVMVVKEGAPEEGTVATACLREEDERRRDKRERRGSPEGRSYGAITCMTHISLKPWRRASKVPPGMEQCSCQLLDLVNVIYLTIRIFCECIIIKIQCLKENCWLRACLTNHKTNWAGQNKWVQTHQHTSTNLAVALASLGVGESVWVAMEMEWFPSLHTNTGIPGGIYWDMACSCHKLVNIITRALTVRRGLVVFHVVG